MKKNVQRILAWIGILLLVGMYASTLLAALFDSTQTQSFFKASILATVLVPVILYGYILIYRYLKNKDS